MAYNTRPLKRAQDGVAPQYYNPTTDEYEALHGTAGANHVVIYGPDGQPAALATEAKLEAVRALLALLEGKDFATDTKAEAIRLLLASLDGKDFASETTLAALEAELALMKAELAAIKANQTSGDQKVQLSGKKASLRRVNASSSAVVEAGKTENIDITPTAGHIGRLRGLAISQAAPPGATKNGHYCNIIVGSVSLGQISAGYDKKLAFSYSAPETGINARPTDSLAFIIMLYNIVFSTANPLRLSYVNNTDVDQTATRYIYALIEEEAIV
jgi:hypothetical protein